MVEFTIPLVLDIICTIGILVGIIYYITIMRNQQRAQEESQKSKKKELILQRHQSYNLDLTRAFWEMASWTDWDTVEDYNEKYGMPNNPEAKAKFTYIMRFYGTAGTLLRENMDNADLIFQLYPAAGVIGLWEQFEEVILDIREKRNSPTHLEDFEFLYREAKKRHPEIRPLSDEWDTNL